MLECVKVFVVRSYGGCACEGFTFSMAYIQVDGIRKDWPLSAWYKGFLVSGHVDAAMR